MKDGVHCVCLMRCDGKESSRSEIAGVGVGVGVSARTLGVRKIQWTLNIVHGSPHP